MNKTRRTLLTALALGACLLTWQGCGENEFWVEDGDSGEPDAVDDGRDDVEAPDAEVTEIRDADAVEDLDADAESGDGTEDAAAEDVGEEEEAVGPEYLLYYGELHGHSEVSDGTGTPEAYFTYCRDTSLMDFCALTDHNCNQSELDDAVALANDFNTPTYVAFAGSEWSHGGINHKPCYNMLTACPGGSASCDTPAELYASVLADGGLCHAAHPAHETLYTDWSLSDDTVEVAGEIYNDEAKMNEAWQMGLKLGVVGISDTHSGVPGSRGVTGCWATGLSRNEILEALAARRCFATNGQSNPANNPMDLTFKIDGQWMGQTLVVESGTTHTFEIVVNGTTNVGMVRLKTDVDIVEAELNCGDMHCEWSDTLDITGPAYYYVLARGSEGEVIWSPPIWIEIGG